jgi:hypothetical protein
LSGPIILKNNPAAIEAINSIPKSGLLFER